MRVDRARTRASSPGCWVRSFALIAGGGLAASAPAAADALRGSWSPLAPWPLVPIHATLLPDGRVLSYGTDRKGQQTGRFVYDLWDPAAGLGGGHFTLPNTTTTDLFCSAQIVLPESGNVLLAGGDNWNGKRTTNHGNDDSLIFDPKGSLNAGADMHRPRWYATVTALPDGEVYVQGGKGGHDRPEVRGRDGAFRLLTGADTSALHWWYPRNWVAPDGRVFGYSDRSMYFVDPRGAGMISGMGTLPPGPRGVSSTEVMFAPGRILRTGGGVNWARETADATSAAVIIDIQGPVPKASPTGPMPARLHWHTATVIADGRVVVTGGALKSNQLQGVSADALIWDPATGAWTRGAATASGRARLYHSTSLLLPDGSILVGGGGAPGPQTNLDAEIYRPPYLHEAAGPRPEIVRAPTGLSVGRDFDLVVAPGADVARVTLVKTGSVTHGFDMDQRFLELAFTRSGATLRVKAPASPNAAPPGTYLLFALSAAGAPSKGRIARIAVAPETPATVDWTPTVGEGLDGSAYTLACPTGQALAGFHGGASASIVSLGPRCVALDAAGRWASAVVSAPKVGPAGGVPFTRTCPKDTVVTAFKAQGAADLTRVELACRSPASPAAAPVHTAAVGTGGGSVRGPFACGTGNPAHALYGRVGSGIRSLGLPAARPTACSRSATVSSAASSPTDGRTTPGPAPAAASWVRLALPVRR